MFPGSCSDGDGTFTGKTAPHEGAASKDPPGSRTRARNSADGAGCFGDAAATGRAGAGAVASRASKTSAGAAGTYLGGRNPFKIMFAASDR